MRRSFAGLIAGLLILSLMGCSMSDLVLGTPAMKRVKIVGAAMEPNFHDGQIVNVEEVPVEELRRGDVILFTVNEGKQYLKRLIGLPGETVEIRDGKVYINDEVLDEPYNPSLPGQDYPSRLLKQDEYFVLGDNRNNSTDSRGFGPVPSESILGRVKNPASTLEPRTYFIRQEAISMLPTISEGEILLMEEVPASQLKRGDIIDFQSPGNADLQILKRLIGLPGETVEVRDGKVFIDGSLLDEPYIVNPGGPDSPSVTLGVNEYFTLGDNRENSVDSRQFGPIPSETIRGRVKQ